jgi:hypothetical protein
MDAINITTLVIVSILLLIFITCIIIVAKRYNAVYGAVGQFNFSTLLGPESGLSSVSIGSGSTSLRPLNRL